MVSQRPQASLAMTDAQIHIIILKQKIKRKRALLSVEQMYDMGQKCELEMNYLDVSSGRLRLEI